MAKQVEQLEKEKKELQERLKNQEKKVKRFMSLLQYTPSHRNSKVVMFVDLGFAIYWAGVIKFLFVFLPLLRLTTLRELRGWRRFL